MKHSMRPNSRLGEMGLELLTYLQECRHLGFVYRSMYFRTSELNIATSVPIPAEPKNIIKNLNWHTDVSHLLIKASGSRCDGITFQCQHRLDRPWSCPAPQSHHSPQWWSSAQSRLRRSELTLQTPTCSKLGQRPVPVRYILKADRNVRISEPKENLKYSKGRHRVNSTNE